MASLSRPSDDAQLQPLVSASVQPLLIGLPVGQVPLCVIRPINFRIPQLQEYVGHCRGSEKSPMKIPRNHWCQGKGNRSQAQEKKNPRGLACLNSAMHRHEIRRLRSKVAERGLTLIPLALYWKDGRAKVELAVARGKRRYDKREAIRRREQDREAQRAARQRGRRGA